MKWRVVLYHRVSYHQACANIGAFADFRIYHKASPAQRRSLMHQGVIETAVICNHTGVAHRGIHNMHITVQPLGRRDMCSVIDVPYLTTLLSLLTDCHANK